jgi:hypothetical protein
MDGLGHLTSVARDAVPRPPAGGRAGDRSSKLLLRHSDLWQTLGHEPAPAGMGPLAIGLALTLIHLISIPVTNTSVNPARSTGPALFVGGWALGQPRSAPRDPGRIVLFRTVAGADEQRFRGRVTRLSARTALAVQSCSSVCRAARLVQRATRGTEAAVEADTQQPIPGTSR